MSAERMPEAGGITPPATIEVWDLFVRMFHWLLVVSFAVAWYSGGIWDQPHLVAGYCVLALIIARVFWGVIGSRYARFSNFVYGPRAIFGYLADAVRMRAPRYLGHNPAGGVMIIALLADLAVLCISGVMMTTDAFWGVKWVNSVHAIASSTALVLIGLHIAGVIFASVEHRENLARAMFTGRKRTRC